MNKKNLLSFPNFNRIKKSELYCKKKTYFKRPHAALWLAFIFWNFTLEIFKKFSNFLTQQNDRRDSNVQFYYFLVQIQKNYTHRCDPLPCIRIYRCIWKRDSQTSKDDRTNPEKQFFAKPISALSLSIIFSILNIPLITGDG